MLPIGSRGRSIRGEVGFIPDTGGGDNSDGGGGDGRDGTSPVILPSRAVPQLRIVRLELLELRSFACRCFIRVGRDQTAGLPPDRDMVDVIAVANNGLLVLEGSKEIPLDGRDQEQRQGGPPESTSNFTVSSGQKTDKNAYVSVPYGEYCSTSEGGRQAVRVIIYTTFVSPIRGTFPHLLPPTAVPNLDIRHYESVLPDMLDDTPTTMPRGTKGVTVATGASLCQSPFPVDRHDVHLSRRFMGPVKSDLRTIPAYADPYLVQQMAPK